MSGVQALSALEHRPTAVIISDQLRERIIDGAFKPGDQINEAQVASQLRVSRGPVREALHRLVQEGLLIGLPNRGVFVREITDRDVAEIYEAREVIECAAAEIVTKLDEAERDRIADELTAVTTEMGKALAAEQWDHLRRLDLQFHTTLVEHGRNRRLVRAYSTLATEALICMAQWSGFSTATRDRVVPSHLDIVEKLRSGDMEAVHLALHNHLSLDDYELHTHDEDGSLRHGRPEE